MERDDNRHHQAVRVIRGPRLEQLRRRLSTLARELRDAIAAGRSQAVTDNAATHGQRSTAEEVGSPGTGPSSTGRTSWDAYVDWLEESARVRNAYERWSSAASADAWLAFAVYRAALDREEHASRWFQALAA
ncbi:MAG: hypothetical protein JWO02_454 [Solirubrobacterales bacterium]|nr:hypothetical protein [Solirubrobacterales bacterium]